jgi:putative SOS response-associated peptidase YedK
MCGKITQPVNWARLLQYAEMIGAARGAIDTITPMRVADVIRLNAAGTREAVRMRWGFVPANAPDPSVGTKFIHVRAETIEQKPTYREAFFQRRGLLVVNTFNEGKEITPTKTAQHIISPRDSKPIGIAVIWERWAARGEAALLSFAQVTVPANKLIARITDRMPASVDELKALLVPFEGDWDMESAKKPPPPPKPSAQADLF